MRPIFRYFFKKRKMASERPGFVEGPAQKTAGFHILIL
jgi:hypothetical protein